MAGVHNYSTEESYVWPEDPKVLRKLEWFQDQKLGLMMHWGSVLSAGDRRVLGAERCGCGLVQGRHRLGSDRRGVQEGIL